MPITAGYRRFEKGTGRMHVLDGIFGLITSGLNPIFMSANAPRIAGCDCDLRRH